MIRGKFRICSVSIDLSFQTIDYRYFLAYVISSVYAWFDVTGKPTTVAGWVGGKLVSTPPIVKFFDHSINSRVIRLDSKF